MKITNTIFIVALLLLFVYTSASKFLDYEKFVFQMQLAPVPLMKLFAPFLGWVVPLIEMIISICLALGFFYSFIQIRALYVSVILLTFFEVYISSMLLSGSNLPCTCGGIVSQLGWGQHLFLNAFFVIGGILSIKYLKKHTSEAVENNSEINKILSRA